MNYLSLLILHGRKPLLSILLAALLAGGAGLAILAIITQAAEEISREGVDRVNWGQAAAFIVAAGLFFFAESTLVARVGAAVEQGIHSLRLRLIDRLLAADFVRIESFSQEGLYQNITQNSQVVSDNSALLAMAVRSVVLALAILGYIFWLSSLAFFLVLATLIVGGILYLRKGYSVQRGYAAMISAEGRLFAATQDLFDGAKEVRLSTRRSSELGEDFCRKAATARRHGVEVQTLADSQFVFGQTAFYGLLAVVAFILPLYSSQFDDTVLRVTAAVLFMIGPVGAILGTMPTLAAADAAVRRMKAMEAELAELAPPPGPSDPGPVPPEDFRTLSLRGAGFSYPAPEGETPFTVGPVNLSIRRGEVVFITGGNGSGKSSFLKMLTGLYDPQQGAIAVDDVIVDRSNVEAYRHLIATVFSDNHLFARLYGMPEPDPDEAAELFRLFEMERVTRLEGNRFGRTALSMGQRKRLALIAALLEHKPILVLDEWAADQDPHFRRVFYHTVLPMLKARGVTVLAVTHDDHYFETCDRILHFSFGTMEERPPGAPAKGTPP